MESIATVIIGVIIIIIGIINRKGNVSMLHSYHRKRVSDDDMLPFGKMVGLGMIIIGIGLIITGGLLFASTLLKEDIYSTLATAISIVGLVIGSIIAFYAMIKYNKGIF